ncbi:MAG: hypothetical protein QOF49_412 [Chloroflexota bacterium]|nr:hypothetical protein [Chloroflexota bacterium]
MQRRTTGALALAGAVLLGALAGAAPVAVAGASCIATGAVDRDGTALTARIVNPVRPVTGRVDATGCEVGVYFSRGTGKVVHADVFGARYYGVLIDGNGHHVVADVRNSTIHDIGELPLSAARHGEGVAYRGFGGTANGTVAGNRIWNFQEAGINLTGPGASGLAFRNRVTGRGETDVISQNGIQVIFGAHGTVRANAIANLRYTGPNFGNGVLVVGGEGYGQPDTRDVTIDRNVITGADIGINVFEIDEAGNPSPLPTRIVMTRNVIRNDRLTNIAGWSDDLGLQAGIADYANGDRIVGNRISGLGYDADACGAAAVCTPILTDGSIDPIISGNVLR